MRYLISLIAIGMLAAPQLQAACPSGQAGRLSGRESYNYLGEVHNFTAGDQLEFDFAVIPAGAGTLTVGGDDDYGQTAYQVLFAGGVVSDADYGDLVPLLEYVPGAWNDLRATFDIGSQMLTITVNGVSCAPRPFEIQGVSSLQAVRVNLGDLEEGSTESVWLDQLRVVLRTPNETRVLYEANFETGSTPASFEIHPYTDGGDPVATCGQPGPTAVTAATWGKVKSHYR